MAAPISTLIQTIEEYKRFYGENETEAMKHIRSHLRDIYTMPKPKRDRLAQS